MKRLVTYWKLKYKLVSLHHHLLHSVVVVAMARGYEENRQRISKGTDE